jgi:hypothetical protein
MLFASASSIGYDCAVTKKANWLCREEPAKGWRMSCLGSDAMSACQSEKADRANEKRFKLSYLGARVLSPPPD